jgi:hypothetical protein
MSDDRDRSITEFIAVLVVIGGLVTAAVFAVLAYVMHNYFTSG